MLISFSQQDAKGNKSRFVDPGIIGAGLDIQVALLKPHKGEEDRESIDLFSTGR